MKTGIVGLTGGIGSGKSTIAGLFASFGVPVYIADDEAKKIAALPDTVQEIKDEFGDAVFTNNMPDRKKLAAVVFNNPEKLARLNAIIHPKVSRHFKDWLEQHKSAQFVIKEAAILFESGSYKDCDRLILVTAPAHIRLARVIARDNTAEDEVRRRMASQWDDDRKKPLSDYVIVNVDREETEKQVRNIFEKLKKCKF